MLDTSVDVGGKCDRSLWDEIWAQVEEPYAFLPEIVWVHHVLSRLFRALLPEPPASLIEIGCGASQFLPYLAKDLGFEVSGLDYSEKGLALCRKNLDRHGVRGDLYKADFFNDEQLPNRKFDAVVSFGFVEHFQDTVAVLKRMRSLLNPGGTLLTTAPNLRGINGAVMRWLDPHLYRAHVTLSADKLSDCHQAAGLSKITYARYFGTLCLQATSWKGLLERLGPSQQRQFLGALSFIDRFVWKRCYKAQEGPECAWLSPNVIVAGKEPV